MSLTHVRSHAQSWTHHQGPGMWLSAPWQPRGHGGQRRALPSSVGRKTIWIWWQYEGWIDDNDKKREKSEMTFELPDWDLHPRRKISQSRGAGSILGAPNWSSWAAAGQTLPSGLPAVSKSQTDKRTGVRKLTYIPVSATNSVHDRGQIT